MSKLFPGKYDTLYEWAVACGAELEEMMAMCQSMAKEIEESSKLVVKIAEQLKEVEKALKDTN